jgi:hypothetical protein
MKEIHLNVPLTYVYLMQQQKKCTEGDKEMVFGCFLGHKWTFQSKINQDLLL